MKTAEPETIYLQIGDDADITEFKKDDFQTNSISWCWERIFPNDIEYVSKQSVIGLIDAMIEPQRELQKSIEVAGINRDYQWWDAETQIRALSELKQKIESMDDKRKV